jgi:hypothetical protein
VSGYTIEHRGRCILIKGTVPVSAMSGLIALVPLDSVASPDVARMYGVNFAFGPADELRALHAERAPIAESEARANHPNLSPDSAAWLASGERGISSDTMFQHLTGVRALRDGWHASHPHDPDDLGRCRKLLEQVPDLQPRLADMASCSPEWARLVARWTELCTLMDEEAPRWREGVGDAPKTYALMQQLIKGEPA